jgi:hypothetical protein
MDRRARAIGLLVGVLALLALAACGSSEADSPPSEKDTAGIPIVRIDARYATAFAADLGTLISAMDVAFVGEVVAARPQREQAIGARGGTVPISVFEVHVERSAGGPTSGSIVTVEQVGGLTTVGGETVRVLLERDTPVEPGARYLFIAEEITSGAYVATSFARFPIEDGVVRAPAGWEGLGASAQLAGASEGQAMERVRDAR